MEQIWAPWRIEYILQTEKGSCFLCQKPKENKDESNFILHRGESNFISFHVRRWFISIKLPLGSLKWAVLIRHSGRSTGSVTNSTPFVLRSAQAPATSGTRKMTVRRSWHLGSGGSAPVETTSAISFRPNRARRTVPV